MFLFIYFLIKKFLFWKLKIDPRVHTYLRGKKTLIRPPSFLAFYSFLLSHRSRTLRVSRWYCFSDALYSPSPLYPRPPHGRPQVPLCSKLRLLTAAAPSPPPFPSPHLNQMSSRSQSPLLLFEVFPIRIRRCSP